MVDHSGMKLGRREIRKDARTLRLATYIQPELPKAPDAVDYLGGISNWGMMLNDQLGCCTIAGIGHGIQVWSRELGREVTVPDSDILDYYEKWDGYKPGDDSTDQGGVELDVLRNFKHEGFAGHTLSAFVEVNPADMEHVRLAVSMFGFAYIGVSLPLSAQRQEVWDAVDGADGEPGSWGGHCVIVPKYVKGSGLWCISWGGVKQMTEAFWAKYVDEAYALLSPDWVGEKGSPVGIDMNGLASDLSALRS